MWKVLILVAIMACVQVALSKVIHIKDEKEFKNEVLNFGGVAIVEFYAPWCGHCKSLEPEYKKAASALNGVVKVVAIDATVLGSLGQKYGVQGYPTLKMFGLDKKKPTDFQGERKSDAIISGCMKAANGLVKDRKAGKKGSPTSNSNSKKDTKEPKKGEKQDKKQEKKQQKPPSGGSKRRADTSDVVTLTEENFKELVMDSDDHWMVEFYAPWCGHCKSLAPEWEEAAQKLAGNVRLGMVDATVHESIAQKYQIKGFPTIKLFPAGPKGKAQDYSGPRDSQGIVDYALKTLDETDVPMKTPQVTGKTQFETECTSQKICVIAWLPHILDSGAKQRNSLIEMYGAVAKSLRGKPVSFVWSEASAQPALESSLEVNANYPALSILSGEKGVYATQRSSWSKKNCQAFLNGIISGTEKKSVLTAGVPAIDSVKMWDGKDAEAPKEEFDLDDLMSD